MSQQINLFNPIFLKQKKYFSAVTMLQALALIVIGSALLGGYARYSLFALSKEAETTAAQLASAQARMTKVSAEYGPKEKSKALENEIAGADQQAKSLLQVFALLEGGDFGNTSGYAEYMRAFSRQIVQGVWLTGFQIRGAGRELSIIGRALQADLVPTYITRLKSEPVLQGKSFAMLEMQSPQSTANPKTEATPAQRGGMAYINFNLRSSDAVKEQQAEPAKDVSNSTSTAYLEFARALAAIKEQADTAGAKSK
jgi:Tfp pilus assembly protein PilN